MEKELLDRLAQLQEKYFSLQKHLHLDKKRAELEKRRGEMNQPDFWGDQEKAQKTSQKAAHLEKFIEQWKGIESNLKALPELIESANETEQKELQQEVERLEEQIQKGETELLLSGPYDQGGVILSLHVGNGGQDAEDFTHILERMYLRFCEKKEWKTHILDESPSESGLKSATIEINGTLAYGLLKSEHGVHRLIRLSPFNAKNLRQTSFTRVEILPLIDNEAEIQIDEKDLRIDVFRSSGCGGQSVNTTDSAVRITYLPLNLVVTCQNEKSQLQNKQSAMKVLKSRLLQLKLEQRAEKFEEIRGELMESSFGSQIRTYTLQPYKLVKDHRTDCEHPNPEAVFNGDLEDFIDAFLQK
ncbi:peptide chain release factor 2 [Candidatus Gracilibacteria bacterium]|nr:peptide chain release factor 2 [Candidatus Gracilibacteria bacterium]MCF7819508.1 peptide chain release factor 2 [Candidatus Gracilibacteria bacterium]